MRKIELYAALWRTTATKILAKYLKTVICKKIFPFCRESDNYYKILIFNSTGQREVEKFLEILSEHRFDVALFTTNSAHSKINSSSDQINYNTTLDDQYKKSENHLKIWKNINNINDEHSYPERFQVS